MVQGNFHGGDYFIDCNFGSQSLLRSTFGVWINICFAIIAISTRYVYCSGIKRRLLANDLRDSVSLWEVSPATNTSEVIELRAILFRYLFRGKFFYVIASFACVIAAIVSAASTAISNHTIVTNMVTRRRLVQGRLVTHDFTALGQAYSNLTTRHDALARANAPEEEVFDFVPDDASGWIYVPEEWNNTWQGHCKFSLFPAVDLDLSNSNSLLQYIPQWAQQNPDQGLYSHAYAGYYDLDTSFPNKTGAFRDFIITFMFGNSPNTQDPLIYTSSPVNISFLNYLGHHVGRGPNDTVIPTLIKSDVHVVECTYINRTPGARDQAYPEHGQYASVLDVINGARSRSVMDTSILGKEVVQRTGREMLRDWQAFLAVKDSQYPHIVQRTLTTIQPVLQIRLSALLSTVVASFAAIVSVIITYLAEPRGQDGKRLSLDVPQTPLDWIAQSARECGSGDVTAHSPSAFATQRDDLKLGVSSTNGGQLTTRIISVVEERFPAIPLTQFDPSLSYIQDSISYTTESHGRFPASPLPEFDPSTLYHRVPMSHS